MKVSELIGHGDLKQTLRYRHSSLEAKQETVVKLSKIYLPSLQPAAEPLDNPMAGERLRLGESIN